MTFPRRARNQISVVIAVVLVVLLLVAPRVWVEWRWFEQFNFAPVLLRRLDGMEA